MSKKLFDETLTDKRTGKKHIHVVLRDNGDLSIEVNDGVLPDDMPLDSQNAAFHIGLILGKSLAKDRQIGDAYSPTLMTKKECRELFDRSWKNIKTRVRFVEVTSKFVRIHKDDLGKRW